MKQIYTLTIEFEHFWDEDDEWRRVVEVEDSMELYNLHLFIQEVVEFDNDHLFEFFLGTSRRNRKVSFGDDGGFGNGEVYGLDTELKEIFRDRPNVFTLQKGVSPPNLRNIDRTYMSSALRGHPFPSFEL